MIDIIIAFILGLFCGVFAGLAIVASIAVIKDDKE